MNELPTHARAVIIGGGIVGCSLAYHLAGLGWRDVVLLERRRLTCGTTWHAAGLVREVLGSLTLSRLAHETMELFARLEAETGQATGLKRNGSLGIATNEERWEEHRRSADLARILGIEVHLIGPREAQALYPLLNVDDVIGAIYYPNDGQVNPADAAMASTARALLNWHRSHGFCSGCGARTEILQGGWQRQCPACDAAHFPRTDPVVLMLVLRGNRLLLGRSPGWPEGMYSALAGFVEPGETLEAAVRREVREETGIRVGDVAYVGGQPWAWPNSLMLGFVARAESEAITLDPAELEDALWVSREEMVDIVAGLHPRIRRPRPGAVAAELLARWLTDTLP